MKKIGNEIKLYFGIITSVIGNRIFDFANNLFIANINLNSTYILALYQSFESIVAVILNLFGGVISDLSKRKNMIVIITDICSGILMLLLLISPSDYKIMAIIIVNILLSVLSSFNSPASRALVKFAIKEERILKFNSLVQISNQLIKVFTPIVTLFLMRYLGYNMVIIINAITFFVSAFLEYKLELFDVNVEDNKKERENIFVKIGQGFVYLFNDRKTLTLVIVSSFVNIFFAGYNLFIPYSINIFNTVNVFNTTINPFALFNVMEAIGGMIGAFLAYKVIKITLKNATFYYLCLTGMSIVCFYLSIVLFSNCLISALFILMFSVFLTMFNLELFTSLQRNVDDNYIGRVFSIIFTIAILFMPIGTFIFSSIFLTTETIQYLIIGGGIVISSILGIYFYEKIK